MKTLLLLLICTVSLGVGWQGDNLEVGALQSTTQSQVLTADDQVVDLNSTVLFDLSSDSAVAVNRTWVPSCPLKPHLVSVYFTGGNAAQLVDGASLDGSCGGTVELSANWTAAQDGVLTLVSDGTNYREIARSNN